jgi:hypothetical protein
LPLSAAAPAAGTTSGSLLFCKCFVFEILLLLFVMRFGGGGGGGDRQILCQNSFL